MEYITHLDPWAYHLIIGSHIGQYFRLIYLATYTVRLRLHPTTIQGPTQYGEHYRVIQGRLQPGETFSKSEPLKPAIPNGRITRLLSVGHLDLSQKLSSSIGVSCHRHTIFRPTLRINSALCQSLDRVGLTPI